MDADTLDDQAEHHICLEEEQRERRALAEAAAHVLWAQGQDGGHRPGSYMLCILEAWAYADDHHHALLKRIYRPYADAVEWARSGDWDMLRYAAAQA